MEGIGVGRRAGGGVAESAVGEDTKAEEKEEKKGRESGSFKDAGTGVGGKGEGGEGGGGGGLAMLDAMIGPDFVRALSFPDKLLLLTRVHLPGGSLVRSFAAAGGRIYTIVLNIWNV
jgi:hypothetical protein